MFATVPGAKKKGGGYKDKVCPHCSHRLTEASVSVGELVDENAVSAGYEPFLDGDDVAHRYGTVSPHKRINVALAGWQYKSRNLYASDKLLIRQASVAIVAGLDQSGARCPQSVYFYRLRLDQVTLGYRHEFLLAALLSRTMAYVVFKLYAEVDPDKAHPKLTHARLFGLPVPQVDFTKPDDRAAHGEIVKAARLLLAGTEPLGGDADKRIEIRLRQLWGLSSDDGAYINGEFFGLPPSQPLRELFPDGVPRPAR
jgi:hypothetical protein